MATSLKSTLMFNGAVIRDRAEMLSLTDMWKAGGSDASRRPYEWSRKEGREFIAFLAEAHNTPVGRIYVAERGKGGSTFAHWQIALAYAKYLSPEFHMWCNTIVRAHMEGRHQSSELVLTEEMKSVIGGIVKRVVGAQIGEALAHLLPAMVQAAISQQTHVLRQGKTAGQIWRAHDLPKLKGAAVWLSNRLKTMGCQIEHDGRGELGVVRARLFDPDKVETWLRNGGIFAVRQYVQERQGQGKLRLVTP